MTRIAAVCGLCLASVVLLMASAAAAQESRCAGCHFATPSAPAADHVADWYDSAHRDSKIGCEKCHGGDPGTIESPLAHRGVLYHSNPASPVNRRNLPATCGTCHKGPFAAFQNSRHFELLNSGDDRVPICATCHGAAGLRRPSPKSVEGQCRQCHGPSRIAPRPERAEQARTLYEALNDSRDRLDAAKTLTERITDRTRRAQFEEAYKQAEVPLLEAAEAGHAFVYDSFLDRLSAARQRIDALLGQLANPR